MSDQDFVNSITLAYIVAAVLFILGLRRLGSPATARSGNAIAALGMLIAVVATLLDREIVTFTWIVVGGVVGAGIGAVMARKVQMTAMPQMVAVFNGFGGAGSALVAAAELLRLNQQGAVPEDVAITVMFSAALGSLTFTGSFIAFGKLQGFVASAPVLLPGRHVVNLLFAAGIIFLSAWLVAAPDNPMLFGILGALALVFGVLLVIPIGGADMPVVISLLNAYSGLAAAGAGFALDNKMLIIAGALVGASGLILTRIMTKAMNRSLANVMFGGFGAVQTSAGGPAPGERPYRSVTAEDAAMVLAYSSSVIFVPGYGLAVAQAQHAVRELADLLQGKGIDVKYAIHPVAGRMPGHMNVLLAEANVPYDQLYDLEINSEFERTDVAVVIGANDVTNPQARSNPESPIYGMPILDVDKAQHVLVLKRSMNPGFAGIDNDLFYLDNTMMLFGDAKDSIESLVREVKEL